MKVLGIETSCDDTAVAVYDEERGVLSNVVAGQSVHAAYGGVVPELASREHLRKICPAYGACLREAGLELGRLDAVAVTHGPGLIGSLLVGLSFAKGLAFSSGVPLVGVNHVEAHLFSFLPSRLECPFPFVGLVASGGHTEIVHVRGFQDYTVMGSTVDDSAGEAFDKVGVLLGLGYPAGPALDRLADQGDPRAVRLPEARIKRGGKYDLSFSGIKTAVRRIVEGGAGSTGGVRPRRADVAAAFRLRVASDLVSKLFQAARDVAAGTVLLAGGVARNSLVRTMALREGERAGIRVVIPAPEYCSDNGAMVAAVGALKFRRGSRATFSLDAFPTMSHLF